MSFGLLVFGRYLQNVRLAALDLDINKGDGLSSPKVQKEEYHAKTTRPNILWITSEDNSIEWISCYGSKNAKTPNIDQLAKEGFRYLYCFDNGAVCAPTRSSWITGMHSISNGSVAR